MSWYARFILLLIVIWLMVGGAFCVKAWIEYRKGREGRRDG